MDPLSIIASSLAIVSATSTSLKIFRRMIKANQELSALLAEIEEVEVVLKAADTAIRERQAHATLPQSLINAIVEYVEKSHERLQKLRDLIEEKFIKACGPDGDLKTARIAWAREKSKVHTMQQGLREIRISLPGIWGAINISSQTQMALKLEEILGWIALHPTRAPEGDSGSQIDTDQHLGTQQPTQDLCLGSDQHAEGPPSTIIVRNMEEYRSLPDIERGKLPQSYTAARIRAPSFRIRRCGKWCSCVCHKIKNVQTPESSRFIIGLLSISFSGLQLWSQGCSEHCNSQTDPAFRATYFLPEWLHKMHLLPEWLVARAIHFAISLNGMKGIEHTLRTPRVIPASAKVFSLAVQGKLDDMRMMFDKGEASPWDVAHSTGRGVLAYAVTYNHQELAQFLVDSGADPDAEEHDKRSSVAIAWTRVIGNFVAQETIDVWRSMFDYETHLESRMYPPLTKIVLGLAGRDASLRDQLSLSSRGINEVDAEGRTALSWAAARGELDNVKTLLEFGANPNVRNYRWQSPLHFAAQNEHAVCGPIARALLEHDAEVNFVDHWKRTALIYGACNQKEICDLAPLIEYGANLNAQDVHERTPLSYAAKMDRVKTLKYLLEKGCDPSVPDNWGMTPLIEAIQLNKHEVVQILLQDPRSTFSKAQGKSVLEQAALGADLRMMYLLANSGCVKIDGSVSAHNDLTPYEIFERRTDVTAELRAAFETLLISQAQPLPTPTEPGPEFFEDLPTYKMPGTFVV